MYKEMFSDFLLVHKTSAPPSIPQPRRGAKFGSEEFLPVTMNFKTQRTQKPHKHVQNWCKKIWCLLWRRWLHHHHNHPKFQTQKPTEVVSQSYPNSSDRSPTSATTEGNRLKEWLSCHTHSSPLPSTLQNLPPEAHASLNFTVEPTLEGVVSSSSPHCSYSSMGSAVSERGFLVVVLTFCFDVVSWSSHRCLEICVSACGMRNCTFDVVSTCYRCFSTTITLGSFCGTSHLCLRVCNKKLLSVTKLSGGCFFCVCVLFLKLALWSILPRAGLGMFSPRKWGK